MPALPDFGHINKCIIEFMTRDKVLFVTSITEIMTS